MAKISVLGAGAYGFTWAVLLGTKYQHNDDVSVNLWVRDEKKALLLGKGHRHHKFADLNVTLPPKVDVSSKLEDVVSGSDIVLSTIPSEYLDNQLNQIKTLDFLNFINGAKGVINDKPIYMAFKEKLPKTPYGTISGPNIARDILNNFRIDLHKEDISTVSSVIALESESQFDVKKRLEYNMHLKLYPQFGQNNILSVEYRGILKNAYAIFLGAAKNLVNSKGERMITDSTYWTLLSAAVGEIKKILNFYGYESSYDGYDGIADLGVTIERGRNGRMGKLIALEGLLAAQEKMKGQCVEGLRTVKSLYENLNGKIALPILKRTYEVLYEGKTIKDVAMQLRRTPTPNPIAP